MKTDFVRVGGNRSNMYNFKFLDWLIDFLKSSYIIGCNSFIDEYLQLLSFSYLSINKKTLIEHRNYHYFGIQLVYVVHVITKTNPFVQYFSVQRQESSTNKTHWVVVPSAWHELNTTVMKMLSSIKTLEMYSL